ncbi:MAG: VOC family protein, partial [Chitinophagaceae bacterium]
QIDCETQEEIDHYWNNLTEKGEEGPCGWLKDKYGVSWQIVPSNLADYLTGDDPERSGRVTAASLQMKKFNIAKLKEAYQG